MHLYGFGAPPSMRALPVPQRGGSIDQLRRFVNLSDNDFILFVAVLLDALRPGRPHPVLFLTGEEGSAKSTAATIARSLIDPNVTPLRTLPGTVRDLFVSVHNSHMLVCDNVSNITPAISDALCQISSGSGFATRRLYTNSAEFLVGGSRPVILNGLGNGITRSDLADRAVVLRLIPIERERRRSDTHLWARVRVRAFTDFWGVARLRRPWAARAATCPPTTASSDGRFCVVVGRVREGFRRAGRISNRIRGKRDGSDRGGDRERSGRHRDRRLHA